MTLKKFIELAQDMTGIDDPVKFGPLGGLDFGEMMVDRMRELDEMHRRMEVEEAKRMMDMDFGQMRQFEQQRVADIQRRRMEMQRAVLAPPPNIMPEKSPTAAFFSGIMGSVLDGL